MTAPLSASTQLTALVSKALTALDLPVPTTIHLEHPADSSHGDYATNVAMALFGQLTPEQKTPYRSPRDLATGLVDQLKTMTQAGTLVKDVTLAGPGFINFQLSEHYLLEVLAELLAGRVQPEQILAGERIIFEWTDPNPFKEFHIGHLYSNIVGESVCRLFEATGATVQRVCYQGDVGMHVAKSVWGMRQKLLEQAREKYPELSDHAGIMKALQDLATQPLRARMKFLGQAYSFGATAYELEMAEATKAAGDQAPVAAAPNINSNPAAAKREIQEINYLTYLSGQENLMESSDWEPQVDYRSFLEKTQLNYEGIKQLYQQGRAWSIEYFEEIYVRLGTQFDDYYFESVVGEYGAKIVRDWVKKGVFRESKGAIIFPGSEHGLHDRVFINSLGLPTYEAKELGLAPEKFKRWPYTHSIILTANEIDEYFKVLITAMNQTHPDLGAKTEHLSHGMVRLPQGKMSSRTGKVLTGEWLLDEAKERVLQIMHEREVGLESSQDLQNGAVGQLDGARSAKADRRLAADSQQSEVAEKVGQGAIKFALLKSSVGKDIAFDFDESLSFSGKSGPYLQYTLVRCLAILRKIEDGGEQAGGERGEPVQSSTSSQHLDTVNNTKVEIDAPLTAAEREVLRYSYQYFEAVVAAARDRAPHVLANYLYELAQSYSLLYNKEAIIGNGRRETITRGVAQILQSGFNLLGIPVVERM